jgi:hypothetical protein
MAPVLSELHSNVLIAHAQTYRVYRKLQLQLQMRGADARNGAAPVHLQLQPIRMAAIVVAFGLKFVSSSLGAATIPQKPVTQQNATRSSFEVRQLIHRTYSERLDFFT